MDWLTFGDFNEIRWPKERKGVGQFDHIGGAWDFNLVVQDLMSRMEVLSYGK